MASQQTDGTSHSAVKRATDASSADSALSATDLQLSYPSTDGPVVTVDRLDIPEGEITALVGPNGSGKSTIVKALADQLGPDTGEILLEGEDIASYGRKELARELGHLSQENDAPQSVSVEDLVYHGRYPYRGFFGAVDADDREAVERAIELAGVDHLREENVGNLSGGQKQLAFIAMVLAQETDVLLLDEPTTYLDLHHQLRVMETVERLNAERDVTVAVVLHDIAQASRFADYLIALDDGEVYDWGPPTDVVTEELLRDVFDVEAAVRYTPEPEITPKHSL
ncbi:ABC transporter ATP-binding protein [Haloarcula salinisoli]|uniref:Cobalamin import ATP-binding protein BtuD n=1 Tax=Haloarcula salinisoli TaxID=2487746 RepID=A0A8J7YL26_9EURY|nr:ABC transporter ATP-binding protein [Halomicroarcula salinisoli]MBX0285379.1 ABC transporter ATP-binding protein [Halomicroarcula salinisoli]MBX0303143.1 ABC transporter ATP-binding protein [Halomicroarcula salinisoli]